MRVISLCLPLIFIWSSFTSCCFGGKSSGEKWRQGFEPKQAAISRSITVSHHKERGDYQSIQAAINSIPPHNSQWVKIHIKPGYYKEQVVIPADKPFIYMVGEGGILRTSIEYNGTSMASQYVTFTTSADNFVARNIAFVNTYDHNITLSLGEDVKQAVAVEVRGDKSAFYGCSFKSYQDTLLDSIGRHYFKDCTISGAVDFIFGSGQSIYENCNIRVTGGPYRRQHNIPAFITAQARASSDHNPTGFVFKNCHIDGDGEAYLGRAWGPYSRVIFYNTYMADIIVPLGWDAWSYHGHEDRITYAEANCYGPGSNLNGRVKWERRLPPSQIPYFTELSFIDNEGWIQQQPI